MITRQVRSPQPGSERANYMPTQQAISNNPLLNTATLAGVNMSGPNVRKPKHMDWIMLDNAVKPVKNSDKPQLKAQTPHNNYSNLNSILTPIRQQ